MADIQGHKKSTAPLVHGSPVFIQIPVEDMNRARCFYTNVFQWDFPEPSPGGAPPDFLRVFNLPDERLTKLGLSGGLVHIDKSVHLTPGLSVSAEGTRGVPHMYLLVESIDQTSLRIERAGGKLIGEKKQEDPTSYIAHFLDSEGNVQGMYELIKSGSRLASLQGGWGWRWSVWSVLGGCGAWMGHLFRRITGGGREEEENWWKAQNDLEKRGLVSHIGGRDFSS